MNHNEQYCGGIKKKITAKLMQEGMNGKRDENREEKSNRAHAHPARYQEQSSRERLNENRGSNCVGAFDSPEKVQLVMSA
jgi:hypothetical protein